MHKYLVEIGFIRTRLDYKQGWVVDNEGMNISTYGPVCYKYERDGVVIYWGLGDARKKTPYFYLPGLEQIEITLKQINNE